ncbi:MAG: NAD(P)H-hydrate dehydratase [Myxococcota bacterium]
MDLERLRARGWPCPTGEEMGRVDAHAIERCGIPCGILMEAAGRAVVEAVRRAFPETRRPLVACGGGNNGGDGFVVARLLGQWGPECRPLVISFAAPERQRPEARENLERLMSSGVEVIVKPGAEEISSLAKGSDLLIDALFGVGLSRPVEGALGDALSALDRSGLPTVAIDLPSGISSDTGVPLGAALGADLTVSLGLPKLGLALRPDAAEILVADIGLPEASVEQAGIRQFLLTAPAAAELLPPRPVEGHKGTFGHVLVAGGSEGKTGAAVLAAEGALRTGAGLVTVAAPRSLNAIFEVKLTEAMSLPVGSQLPFLDEAAVPAVVEEAGSRDALVFGPGIGRSSGTEVATRAILEAVTAPTVIDADALNAFAGTPEGLAGPGPRVLTPHPGEAARLLARSNADVQADRVGAARELARRSAAVVLLKGARSVSASPAGEVWINPTGGPGLASGGTGDVLAGVVGALLAQRLGPLDAARLGAFLHGLAGDLGPAVGGLASELAARVPQAWRELASAEVEPGESGPLSRFP